MSGGVISGTLSHIAVGAETFAEILPSEGSFHKEPAGLAHVGRCASETDDTTFHDRDGKFDVLPITP